MEEKEVKLDEKQNSKKKKRLNFAKFIKRLPLTVKTIVIIIIAVLLMILGTKLHNPPDSK